MTVVVVEVVDVVVVQSCSDQVNDSGMWMHLRKLAGHQHTHLLTPNRDGFVVAARCMMDVDSISALQRSIDDWMTYPE